MAWWSATVAADSADSTWKAGVAKAVITPETSVWLAGYGTKRPPDGKLHDLWMKALALEDAAGHRVVLITSDFQGVPKSMSDRVFARLRGELGLERSQVMFTFSHNHCGPRLGDDLVDYYPVEPEQVKLVEEYTDRMVALAVSMVGEALTRLAPARLQTGRGTATFAVNRRNNREDEVPAIIASGKPLVGPVDHDVPVLSVTRPDGRLEAILFGYACHPTTLSVLHLVRRLSRLRAGGVGSESSGRHGHVRQHVWRRSEPAAAPQGGAVPALWAYAGRGGRGCAQAAARANRAGSTNGVRACRAAILADGVARGVKCVNAEQQCDPGSLVARMLEKLAAGETFPPSYPYPVHAWRLGKNTLVIGMGAETVVDYALRFKKEFGPGTWVCGYADDMIAYIPSRRVWEEGGYEGGSNLYEYGRPAFRWSGEIEDRISATVHKLVRQVTE